MDYDIVTLGSATVDYFADSESELIRIDTRNSREELIAFPLGSKILIDELNITSGGGGTNTAVSFSRLGFNTAYLGKIGSDPMGDFVLDRLAEDGIPFIGQREGKTGVSLVLNSIRNDRTILAYKGANDWLLRTNLPDVSTPWIYVSSMMNESWRTVVDFVCENDFKVAFNPSNYQAKMGYEKLRKMIDRVKVLVMNKEEACNFLGSDYHQNIHMPQLARALAKVPNQIAVVTDGPNGVWVYDGNDVYSGKPTADLEILETTGAGDALASTFTAGIIRGLPVEVALDYGMTNAESVLQHKGAKERLLSWEELSDQVKSVTRSIEKCRS